MTHRSRFSTLVVIVAAVVALSGCISDTGYADLARDATEADALPAGLTATDLDGFDLDTVRLVGELDGQRVYLARGTTLAVCLLVYAEVESWHGFCGSDLATSSADRFNIQIVSDNLLEKDGWTMLGRNVRFEDR